jgi:hypothetical protein
MTQPTVATRVKSTQAAQLPGLHVSIITGGTGYVQIAAGLAQIARVVYNGGTNAGASTAAMAGNATVSSDTGAGAADLTISAAASGVATGATGGLWHNIGEGAVCPKGFGVNLASAADTVTVFWK